VSHTGIFIEKVEQGGQGGLVGRGRRSF